MQRSPRKTGRINSEAKAHPLPESSFCNKGEGSVSWATGEKDFGNQGHPGILGIPLNAGYMFHVGFSVTEPLAPGWREPSRLRLD